MSMPEGDEKAKNLVCTSEMSCPRTAHGVINRRLIMRSLRQAFKNYANPEGRISVTEVISTFPISRPQFITHLLHLVDEGGPLARLGGRYANLVNRYDLAWQTLVGLVDLHTHPAAHLGFGTELFYGPPGGWPGADFVDCAEYHWPPRPDNANGNEIRAQVVDGITQQPEYPPSWKHDRSGWPNFPAWPSWHDRLHQQVRVEMLERAWQGGLRIIVALAVNSHTLAKVSQTQGPYDDKSSGDTQIAAIKEMVAAQAFMELALSPAVVRRIVGVGKLAVVIGVELDVIGNFYIPSDQDTDHCSAPFNPAPSPDDVHAEVNRLFSAGVRYFFPVHVLDNVFGGAALYEMSFDIATRYEFDSWYVPEPAPASSEIGFIYYPGETFWAQVFDVGNIVESLSLGFDPQNYPPAPPTTTGHRNSRGLQDPQGHAVLDALMGVGAMIDIDHMCERTVHDTLDYTRPFNYPLFAGHNVIRAIGGNERAHMIGVVGEILGRGGMFGVGTKGGLALIHETISEIRATTPRGGIALGSDCSGMEQLPMPRNPPVPAGPTAADYEAVGWTVYRDIPGAPADALERCQLASRNEDIDRLGFSHIGMYPDLIEDGISAGWLTEGDVQELFNAPQMFVAAWENCLNISGHML
jgi:microsomal dipeptidase-like Zn-dependent dipeptidase